MLNPSNQVLLFRFSFESIADNLNPAVKEFWITPGGKVEDDESYIEALIRELEEETGLENFEVGPWIWTRNVVLKRGDMPFLSVERYYLIRVAQLSLDLSGMTAAEKETLREARWFASSELTSDHVHVRPPGMGQLISALAMGDIPDQPIDIS